ncbi:MAG: hypothetical protein IPJ75_10385 [Ignavibacteriales bacterium]|nr:hypothetical protein [Ignavibacteriales bacterium]
MVSLISFLVHFFSLEYMSHEPLKKSLLRISRTFYLFDVRSA